MWNVLTFILTAILATVASAGILTLLVELLQRGDLSSQLKTNGRQASHQEAGVEIGTVADQRPS
jgi:hypothetical protein